MITEPWGTSSHSQMKQSQEGFLYHCKHSRGTNNKYIFLGHGYEQGPVEIRPAQTIVIARLGDIYKPR